MHSLATLDGLCAGHTTERCVFILDDLYRFRKNLFDVVPEDVLLDWCDQKPKTRYPIVAAAITIFHDAEEAGPRQWTKIALRLLKKVPDRVAVLKQFARQFSPLKLERFARSDRRIERKTSQRTGRLS